MSSEFAIRTQGLSKRYASGRGPRYATLRERLTKPFERNAQDEKAWFWALDDLTVDIPRGRAVGIVGANGAGKSTLLKVLARITEPTRGRAEVVGRVAALLEVGAGFHSELTGIENVYLNGAILGMKRAEVRAKLDSIVGFAEMESFIDAPVKHYSSGMHARLAFSVAAHLEADVLLVDEILAVGDVRFQRKCLAKMGDVLRDGKTVLLVSHVSEHIRRFCSDALWIEHGRVRSFGEATGIVDAYLGDALSGVSSAKADPPERLHSGSDLAIRSVRLRDERSVERSRFVAGERIGVALEWESGLAVDPRDRLGIVVSTVDGLELFGSVAEDVFVAGRGTVRCEFDSSSLAPGEYFVEPFGVDAVAGHHRSSLALSFTVVRGESAQEAATSIGAVRVPLSWYRAGSP